jgi:hypothetical protein
MAVSFESAPDKIVYIARLTTTLSSPHLFHV